MLSVEPLKSATGAADYYTATVNYYTQDAQAINWLGKGKSILRLPDTVDKAMMLSLLEGHLPNGQKLCNAEGEHRPGFDMTFSAPKSVSVLVGLGAAPELIRYHDEAVRYAVGELEKEFAQARISRDGQIVYQNTGNLVIAAFRQPSSRANDPALHTHCVTMNITFVDGKAKSLASDKSRRQGVIEQIQNNAHYGGLLYRHHLANRLKEAGFQLRLTGNGLFEIEGVPEPLLREFSRRREDIEQCMDEKGWTGAKAASQATRLTRPGKEELDYSTLQADWQERANAYEFDAKAFMHQRESVLKPNNLLTVIKEKCLALLQGVQRQPTLLEEARSCVQVAIETLSQRTCAFSERELKAESIKHSLIIQTPVPTELIPQAIEQEKKTQTLYEAHCSQTNQTVFTTPWLLTLEVESLARIDRNQGVVPSFATHQEVAQFQKVRMPRLTYPLTQSQKQAMVTLLTSKDRYLAIQGYAGTAKTTMLAEARLFLEQKGITLRGITVASSAAKELQTKGGIQTDVFPIVLQELSKARSGSLSKSLFIVDEASMLSSPQGHALMKQIERTQARLVFVGDRAQLPSVNTGRLFGLIQEYGIQTAVMDEIVRQKNPQLKEAVVHATRGEVAQALDKLQVVELDSQETRISWIAKQWLGLNSLQREQTLVFAPTHAHREAITQLIRQGLQQEGRLQGDVYLQPTLKTKNLEAVQLRFAAYYQKGDVLRFNQTFRQYGIQAGDYYTVDTLTATHRQKNQLSLMNADGKILRFPLKALPDYKTHTASMERIIEVYQPKTLPLQVGDKLMWTRNFKAQGICNSQMATLLAIEKHQLILKTQEGQVIPFALNDKALKHLDYSYVLTNYKVQGKDALYAIGLIESYQQFSATLKNFYVQISRAVKEMTVITDNRQKLVEAIARNVDEKPASLDMISKAQLIQHEVRFAAKTKLPLQTVIAKKDQGLFNKSLSPAPTFPVTQNIHKLNINNSNLHKPKELHQGFER